jgi:hypothetical protein
MTSQQPFLAKNTEGAKSLSFIVYRSYFIVHSLFRNQQSIFIDFINFQRIQTRQC